MIDYELAKELKDAGFPEDTTGREDFGTITSFEGKEEPIYIPTLSELIDACGNRGLFRLERLHGNWVATTPHLTKRLLVEAEDKIIDIAVAKLWLELNKNND